MAACGVPSHAGRAREDRPRYPDVRMRVIALEEHFVIPSIRAANGDGEWAARMRELGDSGLRLGTGVLQDLVDVGDGRLAAMDAAGIDIQVLSHSQPGVEDLQPDQAVALSREANDFLADVIRQHPSRFSGFALVPTPAPEAAAVELERSVTKLGLKGAIINGRTHGRFLDASDFAPIFEAAAALNVPLYLHPATPPRQLSEVSYSGLAPAISHWLSIAAWGWHVDTGLHALRLITSGLFDRLPQLQIILGHMGEAIPFMLERTNMTLSRRVTALQREVKDYFINNFHVTTSGFFADAPLNCATATIGIDRILFAIDYPYSSNREGRAFLDAMSLTPEQKAKVAHLNAERLLRI